MKTLRFTRIVEQSGRPHAHTLWVAPEKDLELTRARKTHRVMTLADGRGKTTNGIVGFEADAARGGAQILIFPKSLARFDRGHVVASNTI